MRYNMGLTAKDAKVILVPKLPLGNADSVKLLLVHNKTLPRRTLVTRGVALPRRTLVTRGE